MPHRLSLEEQETIIRCSAADSEWDICTADSRIISKLKRSGYEPKPDHQFSAPFVKFTLPLNAITFWSRQTLESRKQRGLERGFPGNAPTQQGENETEDEGSPDIQE